MPFWQFFRKGWDGRALLVRPSKMHHSIWKTIFVLGADEYLERLEVKIRKCLFFYVKIFKNNSVSIYQSRKNIQGRWSYILDCSSKCNEKKIDRIYLHFVITGTAKFLKHRKGTTESSFIKINQSTYHFGIYIQCGPSMTSWVDPYPFIESIHTLWPVNDVTEGSTQEAPMGAS